MSVFSSLQCSVAAVNTFFFAPLLIYISYKATKSDSRRNKLGVRLLLVAAGTYMVLNLHWYAFLYDSRNDIIEGAWSFNEAAWVIGSILVIMGSLQERKP